MTIEEVRPIVESIANRMLVLKVYRDLVFALSRQKFADLMPHYYPEVRDDLDGFRLTFWDKHMDRPLKPNIAQVRLIDSKLYYFYAVTKTQALEEPIVEQLNR